MHDDNLKSKCVDLKIFEVDMGLKCPLFDFQFQMEIDVEFLLDKIHFLIIVQFFIFDLGHCIVCYCFRRIRTKQ